MDKKIIEQYVERVQDVVDGFEYHDMDGFFEDNELSEDEVEELLGLNLKVQLITGE